MDCSALGVALPTRRFTGLVFFFSRTLLYFRVKLSILGLLLQGSGVVIKSLFFFWQSVYIFLINKLDNSSALCANLYSYTLIKK